MIILLKLKHYMEEIKFKMEEKKRIVKVYYCPSCKNRTPWDKHYAMVVCRKCCGEMFEKEEVENE